MHVWLPLPVTWHEDNFVALARNEGVAVAGGANFAIDGDNTHRGIRICIGVGTEEELEEGLRILVRLVSSTPEPALLVI